ncbi:MAG: GNAT family N-acetyltransferase [Thermoanaerobaculaceae bacterium]|jgi:GNAT superfamily N-acetyltransferase
MREGKAPIWTRLLRVYREKGPDGVWFGGLSLVGYRRLVLLERRLDKPVPEISPRVEAEIRPLSRKDEAAYENFGQGGAGIFRKRLERGHQCWGAWCSGSLRHVVWAASSEAWVEYLSCRLLLDDGVAYIYRAFSQPEYRGLGLGPATGAQCLRALQAQGHTVVLAAVLPDNPWAFPPWFKIGFRRIGVVRALRPGRQPWIFVRFDHGAGAQTRWKFERSQGQAPP